MPGLLDRWLSSDPEVRLAELWPTGAPASTGDTWASLVSAVAHAADAVARHTEAGLTTTSSDLPAHVRLSVDDIDGVATLTLLLLAGHVDRAAVLAEAHAFLDEIADEHNGVIHAGDGIASLLQGVLLSGEEQITLPDSEYQAAAVRILAPLLAQRACLNALTG